MHFTVENEIAKWFVYINGFRLMNVPSYDKRIYLIDNENAMQCLRDRKKNDEFQTGINSMRDDCTLG